VSHWQLKPTSCGVILFDVVMIFFGNKSSKHLKIYSYKKCLQASDRQQKAMSCVVILLDVEIFVCVNKTVKTTLPKIFPSE